MRSGEGKKEDDVMKAAREDGCCGAWWGRRFMTLNEDCILCVCRGLVFVCGRVVWLWHDMACGQHLLSDWARAF